MRRVLLGFLVVPMILGPIASAEAQSPKPWAFEVQRKGKTVGRYDFNTVADGEGIFAVAAQYDGARALKASRPGQPAVRCHAELGASGTLGKYKRWRSVGKGGALYWFVFDLEGEVKMRHEGVGGARPKVVSLGRTREVRPLDSDQPVLAWLLVRNRQEQEFPCVGSQSSAIGQARVRKVSEAGNEGAETWSIEGDCGSFRVELGPGGQPVRFVAGDTVWLRINPAP